MLSADVIRTCVGPCIDAAHRSTALGRPPPWKRMALRLMRRHRPGLLGTVKEGAAGFREAGNAGAGGAGGGDVGGGHGRTMQPQQQ